MKKIKFLLFALIAMTLMSATAFAVDGEGTEEAPFIITNEEELRLVEDFPDCYFELANDIELEGTSAWKPLCRIGDAFSGVLDGKGHSISNLNLSFYTTKVGLVSRNQGTIQNLSVSLKPETVISNFLCDGSVYCGIIAGDSSNGTINNCNSFAREITLDGYSSNWSLSFAGISGYDGTISNCTSDVTVKITNNYVRLYGLVCGNNSTNISNSNANIETTSDSSDGWIFGLTELVGTITNSYASGRILHRPTCYYGLSYTKNVTNCYSSISCSYASNYNPLTCNGAVANSFYDKTVAPLSENASGKSTTAMKMKATYTKAGWDFENTWGISKDINDGYPYLLREYDDEELPATSTTIEKVEDMIYYNIAVDSFADGDYVFVANYDSDDRLINVLKLNNMVNNRNFIAATNYDESISYAKIMVVNDLEGISPYKMAEVVEIQ